MTLRSFLTPITRFAVVREVLRVVEMDVALEIAELTVGEVGMRNGAVGSVERVWVSVVVLREREVDVGRILGVLVQHSEVERGDRRPQPQRSLHGILDLPSRDPHACWVAEYAA